MTLSPVLTEDSECESGVNPKVPRNESLKKGSMTGSNHIGQESAGLRSGANLEVQKGLNAVKEKEATRKA